MNTALKIASLAVAMAFGSAAQAASVLIDSFSDGNLANTSSPIVSQTLTGSTSNIIGGQRIVNQISANTANGMSLSINTSAPGVLAHSQDSGETGITTVLWNGGSSLGGVDLTDGGVNDVLRFALVRTDGNLVGNSLSVQINGGGILTHTFTNADYNSYLASGPNNNSRLLNIDFLLTGFTGGGLGVNSILLTINGTVADDWDMRLDNVGAVDTDVPEPGTILLFGAGLIGMASRLQRKSS